MTVTGKRRGAQVLSIARDGRPLRMGAVFCLLATTWLLTTMPAPAQDVTVSGVSIEGNERIENATILKLLGIGAGAALSEGDLNDAYQRLVNSGLFQSVELVPQGGTLVVKVTEYPTINRITFEGNRKLKDDDLATLIGSQARRIFSPAQAEEDAAKIVDAYASVGRMAARVEPKVIKRDGNRVDLVYEIREGRVTEVERLSFTGNRDFSDRRLRQVLETKQAGFLRSLIQRDTFVPERLDFDRQVLTDFYRSRGYIDVEVTGVSSEFTRERDGFLLTFNVREGEKWSFRNTDVVSEIEGVDAEPFAKTLRIRKGVTYSPSAIDTAIARMEEIALQQGLNFVRVEPRITRNPRDLSLDVTFALVRGPRVFVERIDIEGNATTLDRVVRRQFNTVEGDPFNPREIRQAAERIRALGFFANADVQTSPGSSSEQVVVDVNVEEQPTGSLAFGLSYAVAAGAGFNIAFSETNFLGRGQGLAVNLSTGTDTKDSMISFVEPAFLGRDLKFKFSAWYNTSENSFSLYSTEKIGVSPAIDFPISKNGRLELRYTFTQDRIYDYTGSSAYLTAEMGTAAASGLGYTLSFDTRASGFDPNAGVLLRFGQDFYGLGGDYSAVETNLLGQATTKVWNEEVTLRAEVEGGLISMIDGRSRVTDRYFANGKIRGFEPNGIGPRDPMDPTGDALGGNMFAVLRLESEFPIGLPEEYGIHGGVFADVGSVWSLDDAPLTVDDGMKLRATAGVSVFWDTPIGPLRFNFSRALRKESYDQEQNFDLTVSTKF